MSKWVRLRPRDDRGTTLAEVLVTMALLGLVSALVSTALLNANKLFRVTDDQTTGLQDVRTAAERLTRDVRDARSVLCNPAGTDAALAASDPLCGYHLQLWVDYNSDYVQSADETVTWQLRPSSSAGHFDFVRTVNGSAQVEARTIVEQVAFSYDVTPGSTTPAAGAAHAATVNVNMTYDPFLPTGSGRRTVAFTARLRNVS
jgi:prepilin-type N-terminal cleavage/methylation domain-containing protein